MKFTTQFLVLAAAAAMSTAAVQAQISVGAGGSALYDFVATPPPSEWATTNAFNNAGGAGLYLTPGDLTTGVQTISQGQVATNLPAVAANGTFAYMRHNTAGGYLVTQPTTVAAGLLKATLRNTSGGQIHSIDVSYNFGIPVAPVGESAGLQGHLAFFSTNGQANSWNPIAAFSGLTVAAPVSATLFVDVWEPNTDIYLLWADDNASVGADGAYSIDNFQVSNVVPTNATIPLTVSLGAPANGAIFTKPVTISGSATTAGTVPATSVAFFANGAFLGTDTSAPYTLSVVDPPAGTYNVQAFATNGVDPVAASAIHTITVRENFATLTTATYNEDFDVMTATGTLTPLGWSVGATLPADTSIVTVDNGSLAPNAAILGLNYGTTGSGDRALGTAPTGTERNTVLRLRNNTSSNITEFSFQYDGETWEAHNDAGATEVLNPFVSYDAGATWVPITAANYLSPVVGVAGGPAVDGNAPANRVAAISSGTVTPPSPITPGGFLYLRFLNPNEGGTDGGLGVDNVNVTVTAFSQYVLAVAITAPANGANIEADCAGMAVIAAAATASGLTTNVAFQIDALTVVNDTTAPFTATLPAVGVGPHTIKATAKDSLGNTAMQTINVTVVNNQAPVIAFTNTFCLSNNVLNGTHNFSANTGLVFLVGSAVTAQFAVSDANIANVEFLMNNIVLLATNIPFGTLTVGDVTAGTVTLTVRATDTCGAVQTASRVLTVTNPPAVNIVVSNGGNWKYFNSNTAPPNDGGGNQWFQGGYDDSAWLSGFAELGAGDAVLPPVIATVPERTLLNLGPAADRNRAAYFRHTFTSASAISGLTVHSMHDDGAVVYLNGVIVATFNMPIQATYAYTDLAANALAVPGDGVFYYSSNITASVVAGVNTVAVEVHQNAIDSSDIGFDLMLHAAVTGPALTIVNNGNGTYTVTWSAGATHKLQQSIDISSPANWSDVPLDPPSPYTQPTVTPPGRRFFRLAPR